MVKVNFEKGEKSKLVATFINEDIYNCCLTELEKIAEQGRMNLVTNLLKDDIGNKDFNQKFLMEIEKIKKQYGCNDSQAKTIFNVAFENYATYSQLWFSIKNAARDLGV